MPGAAIFPPYSFAIPPVYIYFSRARYFLRISKFEQRTALVDEHRKSVSSKFRDHMFSEEFCALMITSLNKQLFL